MRPTAQLQSGMPTGHKWMGWWGSMGGPKQSGVTSYVVASNQQNPLRGAVSHTLFAGYRRTVAQAPFIVVPLAIVYGIIKWGTANNDLRNSKHGHEQGLFP